MRIRTALTASLVAVVALGALSPALAGPKQVKGSYEVGPLTPDPTPVAGNVCEPQTPSAIDKHPFKVPGAGTLEVTIAMTGDYALGMRDKNGDRLAESDGGTPDTAEAMSVKFKRAETITIEACNFAGAPTATVSYVFTPKKK